MRAPAHQNAVRRTLRYPLLTLVCRRSPAKLSNTTNVVRGELVTPYGERHTAKQIRNLEFRENAKLGMRLQRVRVESVSFRIALQIPNSTFQIPHLLRPSPDLVQCYPGAERQTHVDLLRNAG